MGHDWPLEAIRQQLATALPDFVAEAIAEVDSTNSELMRRARSGRYAPALLVAERQTAGRGRLGRRWFSDASDADQSAAQPGRNVLLAALTFSLALPLQPSDWSGMSLAAGVSVAQSLHPELLLKWPNDIWLDERKLAGILIETAVFGERRIAFVGVGINIRPRGAQGLSTPPAWLQERLPDINAQVVLLRIVPALVQALLLFQEHGFAAFQTGFNTLDGLRGRSVVLSDGTQGTAGGVDSGGALLVHTSAGMKAITSAEVSVRPGGR